MIHAPRPIQRNWCELAFRFFTLFRFLLFLAVSFSRWCELANEKPFVAGAVALDSLFFQLAFVLRVSGTSIPLLRAPCVLLGV